MYGRGLTCTVLRVTYVGSSPPKMSKGVQEEAGPKEKSTYVATAVCPPYILVDFVPF